MRYFIDTEFHEDGRTIDLISIGIVAEDGRELYACNLDAELHRCHEKDFWLKDNVLSKLPPYSDGVWMRKKEIRTQVLDFVLAPLDSTATQVGDAVTQTVRMISDMAKAIEDIKKAVGSNVPYDPLPFPSSCVPSTGSELKDRKTIDGKKPVFYGYYSDYDWVVFCQLFGRMIDLPPQFPMFCMDLKQLSVDVGSPKHPKQAKGDHNALEDARWNRDLYKFLKEHGRAT